MVPITCNNNESFWRAPLTCVALLLLLATGFSFAEVACESSVDVADEAEPTDIVSVPAEIEATLPILIIEEIGVEQVEISIDPVQTSPPATVIPEPPVQTNVANHAGVLNQDRQFALGMIETGNNDSAVGGLGEVSRYQIMPSVWKTYSASRSYRDLDTATDVAKRHWTSLYEYFQKKNEREPTDFDMYVLWNTRFGYYAAKGFDPGRLHPVVRDRAQRFANLVEDSQRRSSEVEMAALR